MNKKTFTITALLAIHCATETLVLAQTTTAISGDGSFEILDQVPPSKAATSWVKPDRYLPLFVNWSQLKTTLGTGPKAGARKPGVISLPTPEGEWADYYFVETEVMHPELAAKFPQIQTYKGIRLDKPTDLLRLDIGPRGFHAQVLSPEGDYYIDPYHKNDNTLHACYYRSDLGGKQDWSCGIDETLTPRRSASMSPDKKPAATGDDGPAAKPSTGATLRTYRLAVAAQGEYTQFHGGSVTDGQSAIVTAINRVTGLTERDLTLRLQLVPNNDLLVYTDPATDPYTDNDATALNLNENQANIDAVIGAANYDIGHVFNTGPGGAAFLGVICFDGQKAKGSTGRTLGDGGPTGDAFYVDYVAHEIGHQLGASHTFNGLINACANRFGPSAFEPGSGSTIMSYANLCGSDNLQFRSDAYYHYFSIDQIFRTIEDFGGCASTSATGNAIPTADAGPGYIIPAQTPFELTAAGSDANGDSLTYCWEQADLGPAVTLSAPDDGQIPLFRSYEPAANPTRTFPRLVDLLLNIPRDSEKLPTLSRNMSFSLVVRDNRLNGGGVNTDNTTVLVEASAGPFRVTAPNTSVTWSGTETVTWDVAGTDGGRIKAYAVDILLSLDGGYTYPFILAANTPNDGSEEITLPPVAATQARIKIKGSQNIFFDVSNQDFTITFLPGTVFFEPQGEPTLLDHTGNGNTNGMPDPGESAIQVYLPLQNTSPTTAQEVWGSLSSPHPDVRITTPVANFPDLPSGAGASNQTPFVISLGPGFPCGNPVPLSLDIMSNEGSGNVGYTLDTSLKTLVISNDFTSGADIPDGPGGLLEVPFDIFESGEVLDVDFSFDGTSCTANPDASTVGLNHDWIGDLVITLINPDGIEVVLMEHIDDWELGGGDGHNLCRTRFSTEQGDPTIQRAGLFDQPYSRTWSPAESLFAFYETEAQGTWTLRLLDDGPSDTGRLNSFSLILTVRDCDVAPPPTTHTIVALPPANGTITPSGAVIVPSGNNQAFTFTADTFYVLDVVTTNFSAAVSPSNGTTNFTYIWSNVTASGSLEGLFTPVLATNDVPLWWLDRYGLNTQDWDSAALADQDGDGAATWQEFVAGTIPTDLLSTFRAYIEAGNIIRWTSASNRVYDLYWTTNLNGGDSLITNDIPASPPLNSYADPLPADRAGYYKVRVKP